MKIARIDSYVVDAGWRPWILVVVEADNGLKGYGECSDGRYYMRDFIPYFELHAADVFMIDVPWNGFAQAKKVGDLAEVYQLNVAPHNYYSHLSSFISASLCAVLPNVRIMEIDIDDVPWKDALVTRQPEINGGHMKTPTGPGWGTELVEAEIKQHLWQDKKSSW